MSQDPEPGWPRPDDEPWIDPAALDSQLGDLIAYCRALTGREEEAQNTAHEVLGSARSLLTDPGKLRAWLYALARMEITAAAAPQAQEIFDLVHRHGIRPEDLPVVLGISPAEADEMLAAAGELRWDDRADGGGIGYLHGQPDLTSAVSRGEMFEIHLPGLVAYCSALTGREDDAVGIANEVLDSAQSLLTDPDRLRSWLFAAVRTEAVGDAPAGAQEILDLVHRHGITARDLPKVLGIAPIAANQLLAAAEDQYVSGVWRDDRAWDDRVAAMSGSPPWGDAVSPDEGAGWDETFGPKSLRSHDIDGLTRRPYESAGRHAAPSLGPGGLRRVLGRGPVRVAAATGVVVAVIGISSAYLAHSNSPPPSQAGQHTRHRPSAVAQSPATAVSPAATAAPTHGSTQPVNVVLGPAPGPAPTSSKPSPRPSPRPTSSSPKPSPPPPTTPPPTTPPPSPSPTPSAS